MYKKNLDKLGVAIGSLAMAGQSGNGLWFYLWLSMSAFFLLVVLVEDFVNLLRPESDDKV